MWGISWPFSGPTANPSDSITQFWQSAYPAVFAEVERDSYPSPRALLEVYSGFEYNDAQDAGLYSIYVSPDLGGYRWSWDSTQQAAYNFRNQIGVDPDLWGIQLYNGNGLDLKTNLQCLAGTSNSTVCPTTPAAECGAGGHSPCDTVPLQKVIGTEFASSSSIESYPYGNQLLNYGDAQTVTTSAAGQNTWLNDTLCTLSSLSIPNTGYYGFYDAKSYWGAYYNQTGIELSWNGYYGLSPEDSTYADKPAAGTMNAFNYSACPSVPLPPVLALLPDATYYTNGDTASITYTANNATSLTLIGQTPQSAISCDQSTQQPPWPPTSMLTGACGIASVIMSTATSSVQLQGTNQPGGSGPSSSATVNGQPSAVVGTSPQVTGLVDYSNPSQQCNLSSTPGCTVTATQLDILEFFGQGFSPTGNNMIAVTIGGSTVWLDGTDGYYFWDGNGQHTQINATLGCFVPPGTGTFKVYNPHSGIPSLSYNIAVLHNTGNGNGSCP